jgi:predicted acyltransferase
MKRNGSLDALRGIAILTMVLSGSIAFGGALPAWMYHAQVPPPDHKFIPTIPGITWVDLVFPFFLFSMGAAIPLSLQRLDGEEKPFLKVLTIAVRRFVLLAFFAYFSQHMKAWVLAETPAAKDQLFSLFAFVLLFFQLYDNKNEKTKTLFTVLRVTTYALAVGLLIWLPYSDKTGFSTKRVDIIILVLANMALFGTLIWWATRRYPWFRIGLLPFVMAVFLGAKEGGWNKALYEFSPVPWLYKFYYLKYLFIIIPGTFAGEWLIQHSRNNLQPVHDIRRNNFLLTAAVLSLLLIVVNVSLLFARELPINLVLTIIICSLIYLFLRRAYKEQDSLLSKFFAAGIYLLLLGLTFEAYEGGVKKDSSTYSYYFITGGLAFFMLIAFYGLQLFKVFTPTVNYLALNGRNPMVAYVAGNLLLLPIMHLTGTVSYWNALNTSFATGLLKGLLFTGAVSLITVFFVKRKWFWKT